MVGPPGELRRPNAVVMPDLAAWTTRIGAPDDGAPERVLLVPPMGDPWWNGTAKVASDRDDSLANGFALAREWMGRGRVRLIGRGATARALWPSWVSDARTRGLVLCEFDAYLPEGRSPLLLELQADAKRWIDEVFAGAAPGVDVGKAFWAQTVFRVLNPAFAAWPAVVGVAFHHATGSVTCSEPTWAGCAALSEAILAAGGSFDVHGRRPFAAPFAVALGAKVAAWTAMSVAKRAQEFWRERGARSQLRRSQGLAPRRPPTTWLAVNAPAPYACRHVTEGALPAVTARGAAERPGLLLHASLAGEPGGGGAWPSLAAARTAAPVLEQCASAESWLGLARTTARAVTQTAHGLVRVCKHGASLRFGSMHVTLSSETSELAHLLTIDVLRAREAYDATTAFLARRDVSGATIVWPHASMANVCIPDLLLRAAGARTVDLVHGMLGDPSAVVTFEQTFSTIKVFWTEAEARYCAPYAGAGACTGGFVPRRLSPKRGARLPGPVRVLVATNYLFETQRRGPVTFEGYQEHLTTALAAALGPLGDRVEVRWRPHPSESQARIDLHLANHPRVYGAVSRARGALQEDLAWADVVVGSISSALIEALCHDVAVLVHDIPLYERCGFASVLLPARRFVGGEDLVPKLGAVVEELEQGAVARLAPEEAARLAVFGAARPRPLEEALWETRPMIEPSLDGGAWK